MQLYFVGWCFKEKMIIGLAWSLVRTGDDGVITSARYREVNEVLSHELP